MNINPVQNVSFGKLYISDDKKTRKVISEITPQDKDLKILRASLEELDKETGDVYVLLSAKEDKHRGTKEKGYRFYLNKNNPDWSSANTFMPKAGGSIQRTLKGLTSMCAAKIYDLKNAVNSSDIDKLFMDYNYTKDQAEKAEQQETFDRGDTLELLDIGVAPW